MTLKTKIDLAFIIGFVALLLITFATYRSTQTITSSFEWITRTQRVLFHLNRALTLTLDIESAQRGYVITGKEEFLEPMENAQLKLPNTIDTLAELIKPEEHQKNLQELHRLIQRKIELSSHVVALRQSGETQQALEFIASGKGQSVTDSIRNLASQMESDEVHMLELRSNESLSNTLYSDQNFILLTGLIIALVVVVYYIIRRNAVRLLKYQREQRILINELTKQNHQLDDFAHITSHNIRSSSSNITGLVNLLKTDSPREEYTMILQRLKTVADNLTLTLNELVDTLQVRRDVDIERQNLSFSEVFSKVRDSLSAVIMETNASISSDFSRAPTLHYPRVYLESILHNLVSNALKYRHPSRNPVITISTQARQDKVVLKITDNGLGIDLKKYGSSMFGFKKTFHYHPQAKGMGLFMTKAQIEALGGTISVESEPDKGSTFTIVF